MESLQPRRLLLLFAGLALMSLGIAVSTRSDLGTTTVSSLPYALSLITPFTLGTMLVAVNVGFLVVQMAVDRGDFRPVQFLQLPISVVFGMLCDAAVWATPWVGHSAYWQQWAWTVVAVLLLATGIAFQISAQTIMLSAEATVMVIARKIAAARGTGTVAVFGRVKISLDVLMVASAAVLAIVFLGRLDGVREGTVFAALTMGWLVKRIHPVVGPALDRFREGGR